MRHLTAAAVLACAGLLLAPAPAEAQGRRLRDRIKEERAKRRADREEAKEGAEDAKDSGKKTKKARAVHGGKLVSAAGHVFEVVLLENEIRVYANREGEPVELKGSSAKVTIGVVRRDRGRRANHQSSSASLRYVGKSKTKGRLRGFLSGSHKLGQADRQAIKLDITISRVPKVKGAVQFEVSGVGVSPQVIYHCPACKEQGKTRRALDPGECPKCEATLEKEPIEQGKRGSFRGR